MIYTFSFTKNGRELSERLREFDDSIISYDYKAREFKLNELLEDKFYIADALIFICATGIAVRHIAPFLKSKAKDPAVIVIDEAGEFVIPILSGHLGGANALAKELSLFLGATPVITTSTDINKLFSVDSFAKSNNLNLSSLALAKEASARLIDKKQVCLYPSSLVLGRTIPKELTLSKKGDFGIYIGERDFCPFEKTLILTPKKYFLGVGMKKNTSPEEFEASALKFLGDNNISILDVASICSATIKRDERAINLFAKKYGLKKLFFSQKELASLDGEFSSSSFVKDIVGVDNVCERSAVFASRGSLIAPKTILNHMTFALAKGFGEINF